MKLSEKAVSGHGALAGLRAPAREWFRFAKRAAGNRPSMSGPSGQEPVRAELFSIERLEQHARSLATAQHVASSQESDNRLKRRLKDNELTLQRAYLVTTAATRDTRSITPAADWLVDNFHIIQEQVRAIRMDLSPGFRKQLPRLSAGPFQGYPRVFGLAWAFVAHTDSNFDPEMLRRFLNAYQSVQPLTIGEIWAVPILLRVILVENLRRLADTLVADQQARQQANAIADRLLGSAPESTVAVLSRIERPLPTAFAEQLVRRLRDEDPAAARALTWLDATLAFQQTDAQAVVETQQQRQGASNVTMRNIITSMRLLSSMEWRTLFESVSPVDAVLRQDSNFDRLDYQTKDLYRHAVEDLARRSPHSETDVARLAGERAKNAARGRKDEAAAGRSADPGFYLIADGRPAFEATIGYRPTVASRLRRASSAAGISGYAGLVAAVTAIILVTALSWASQSNPWWDWMILALLGLIPASDAAMALVNCGATNRIAATALPGLELAEGVPSSLRTIVVVPTLLTSVSGINEQVKRLEVHYLANCDGDLSFALLSDWVDSATPTEPDDERLLRTAADGIASLNARYEPAPGGRRFLLLHRQRLWNHCQGKWIGWERKRGKLHELNRLLRGASDTTFVSIDGHPPVVPADVRYVIILDSDTRLPRGAAKRLIGKMAHPLNRPVFDADSCRVTEGYAVLQPRVSAALPTGRERSLFQRIFANASGIDPYACAVSDVYQDLFGEGSYCGKGIYDVDSFEAALAGRIPENTLLSHDLLEGIFARAGLASDIEVIDEFPTRYDVAVARQSRWARGDWQLLPWILGRRGPAQPKHRRWVIPLVGRWKMLDNLRRSLSAPATFLALVIGWTALPFPDALRWSAFVMTALAVPPLIPFVTAILPRRRGLAKRMHLRAVGVDLGLALQQIVLLAAFLPHQAWVMSEAVLRTLFRMLVSRRNLLEWVTAGQAKANLRLDWIGFYRQMESSVGLAAAAAALVAWLRPGSWPIAAPFLVLWLLAPAIARWISEPLPISAEPIVSAVDARALQLVARRSWRFFETFVTAEDHMLPPDNFQEDPKPVVAHRTSPTNIGLYLLSVVSATDFGWIGMIETVERLEATLETMNRLERHRGHFCNWYDTRDLRSLEPQYVSSVDSGNLAGHLIALWNACGEMALRPVMDASWRAGIEDPLDLLRELLGDLDEKSQASKDEHLTAALQELDSALSSVATTPANLAAQVSEIAHASKAISDLVRERPSSAEATIWADAVHAAALGHQRTVSTMLPWAALLSSETGTTSVAPALAALAAGTPALAELPELCHAAIALLETPRDGHSPVTDQPTGAEATRSSLIDALRSSAAAATDLSNRLAAIGRQARKLFDDMEFGFLFDSDHELLSIGYHVADGALEPNYYDLLASEARLASFVAIAKGDIPTRHWARLGRTMTPIGYGAALTSWSGSMFEYLMPSLVMRAPAGSLLDGTSRQVVREQMTYATARNVPWGVSESAYFARDLELTYQYSSFGIPSLGLERGLGDSTVIAPYATALATMVDPSAAAHNFTRLLAAGARGKYGWYEALDYTKVRLPFGLDVAVVHAYMAHHQGMSIVAIANALGYAAMRRRFHTEPMIQASELLLQERMPHDVMLSSPMVAGTANAAANIAEPALPIQRRFESPHTFSPRTHLLSNGRYSVMLTAAGSGYSRWGDIALTRWQEDATCDSWGSYVFLRDRKSGAVWSAGYQPSGVAPDRYEASFSEGRAEIMRHDGALSTVLEIAVSYEDDAEVRRVSITNHGDTLRDIEVTSYSELVLAPQATDDAHPAFSKLFVETEFVQEAGALLATRRRRSSTEPEVWAAHHAVVEGGSVGDLEFETDRAAFLGRGGSVQTPTAMRTGSPLGNTVGAVLDPVFSLRRHVRLPAKTTARIAFWTLVASSRSAVLDLVDRHHDAMAFDRAKTLAWTQAQVQLRHLGLNADDADVFQRVANRIVYADLTLRPRQDILLRGGGSASILWQYGISGDLPIVLVTITQADNLDLIRRLLLAHEYWRMKQLPVDLVILNEQTTSYTQEFQASLEALVGANRLPPRPAATSGKGAAFVLRADLVSAEARNLLLSAARVVFAGRLGSLSEQIARAPEPELPVLPRRIPSSSAARSKGSPPQLEYFNGFGGFDDDGREYVALLEDGRTTPAPWINVICNRAFGFHVSAEGSGYTWSLNSQQNHLTPWSNDPVRDAPGEVIYVRDEDTGEVWGPTALPIREKESRYIARHGQGYSKFEHDSHCISLELLQYVPVDDPIKISRLKITDTSGRARRLSITAYVEWVLGASRGAAAPHVVTEIDTATGALLAHNPWNASFGNRVAFADLAGKQTSWTGDRREFIGRNGTLDLPAGLAASKPLSNTVGAGLDPCGALQARVHLEANSTREIIFLLGETAARDEAQALIRKYRAGDLDATLSAVRHLWDEMLGTIQVKTPDRAMDIMLNRWLLYQTLSCRVWARAAFYQASGAYGFRDQLQDSMALCVAKPSLAREQLLRAASRQFLEGDVQHWWLPESGRGIRTRISDDQVWLAYVVAHYVAVTGDSAVLDEAVSFIAGPTLSHGENESFFLPEPCDQHATLYEHCALALDRSLATGTHGLPLIGTGDWNDGMNRVGEHGKGESIWLAFLLHTTLTGFAALAEARGEKTRATEWRRHCTDLREAVERDGWDGAWYRRAFFDDGTPLGSTENTECRIDSIAQSWSVMSGAAEASRAARAMAAVEKHLVRHDDRLVLLFSPPFDKTPLEPGYIKGYPPGIRENGGQYTHGAIWSVIAFAMLGDGDRAGELFSLINPINHAQSPEAARRYAVEPYVVAGDIYSEPPHVGRGGWTWYTGSAAWLYRAGLESILGFRLQGTTLVVAPCIPKAWPRFDIDFRHGSTRYKIHVENPDGVSSGIAHADLDGVGVPGGIQTSIPLVDDGSTHSVRLILG